MTPPTVSEAGPQPRMPMDQHGQYLALGEQIIGHGAVTGVLWPIGICNGCGGRVVNVETDEGHESHDRTPPSSPRAGRSTVSAAGEPTPMQRLRDWRPVIVAGARWRDDSYYTGKWNHDHPGGIVVAHEYGEACEHMRVVGDTNPVAAHLDAIEAEAAAPPAGPEPVPQSEPPDGRCTAATARCEKPAGHEGGHYTEYREPVWSYRVGAVPQNEREGLRRALQRLVETASVINGGGNGENWTAFRCAISEGRAALASPAHPDEE